MCSCNLFRKDNVWFTLGFPRVLNSPWCTEAQQATESHGESWGETSQDYTEAKRSQPAAPVLVFSASELIALPLWIAVHTEKPHSSRSDEWESCQNLVAAGPWGACEVILSPSVWKASMITVEMSWQNLDTLIPFSPDLLKIYPTTTQDNMIHLHHNSMPPFSSQEKKELQMGILNSESIGNLPLNLRSTPETMLSGIIRSFSKRVRRLERASEKQDNCVQVGTWWHRIFMHTGQIPI